jgi:hypothetical protein
MKSVLTLAALVALAVPVLAESRSVLVVVTHDKAGKATVAIHSDDQADRREAATVDEALKAVERMRGWGSVVSVAVVTDRPLSPMNRKALFDAIDGNGMLELDHYGREAPKNLADHFLKGGWQLTTTAAGPLPAGRPVPLTLTLKNTTREPLVYGEVTAAGHEHARGISVVDQKGNEVPLTRFGQQWVTRPEDYDRYVSRAVPAGGEASLTLNLALYFDLSAPGTYTVTAQHRFAYLPGEAVGRKWTPVPAAPVTISVTDPRAER